MLRRRPRKRKPLGVLEPCGVRASGGADIAPDGFPVIDGPHYLDVLAGLHAALRPAWYLEIGSFKGHSLAQARCDVVSVDPEFRFSQPVMGRARRALFFQQTSESFFAEGWLDRLGVRPDFAFLDGLHHYETLLADFAATEAGMAPEGVILLHDCVPTAHEMAEREWREGVRAWTGDVWKTLVALLDERPDLRIDVLDAWPTGLAVVRSLNPADRRLTERAGAIADRYGAMTLRDYGVERYYGRFEIQASAGFVAGLGAARPA